MLTWIDSLNVLEFIALIIITGSAYFAFVLFVARVCGLHNRRRR